MKSIKRFFALFLLFACFQTALAGWTKQKSNTLAWLHDVYFLNEQTGWIAGSDGTLLATKDGGATWTKNKNLNGDNFRQIYFTDEQNGWLLGERDLFALGANSPSYLLKTSDGGATWERIEFADNQRKRLTKIFFNKYDTGSAIGENGAFYSMGREAKIWKPQPSPAKFLLSDGLFIGEWNGVIVGAGGSIFYTEDAGLTWLKASIFGEQNPKLSSVFFINQKTGWTVGAEGKIYQTINGGKVWREQKSNVFKDLKGIFFTNTAEGWAVGNEGTMLHSTTAGNVWAVENSNAKHNLEKVIFINGKGWAVGFGGTILAYDKATENSTNSK